MLSESARARLREYEQNLRRCPLLYEAAQLACREAEDPENLFFKSLPEDEAEWAGPVMDAVCDDVISPALHAYVLWVLRQATAEGINRLYFLSRDGYLMYRAAVRICEELTLPVECRYFYCSRYSVRIPMFHMEPEEALDYICRGGIDVTLTKVLNRAGLDEKEQALICGELAGTPFGQNLAGTAADGQDFAEIAIPYATLAELKGTLRESPLFMESMRRHSEEALPALEGYFRQEGLMDEIPMAVVDSGWIGSMQKVINQLLAAFGKQDCFLTGYYWGLYELPADVDPEDYHCYYFAPDTNLREKVYFSNNLFEEIYSAPQGMTLYYEKQKDAYRPVTQEAEEMHRTFIDWIAERTRMYTDKLLAVLPRREEASAQDLLVCANDRDVIRDQFSLFMGNPTPEGAKLFGRLSFSDDVLEYGGQLAAEMTEKELTENHAARKVRSLLRSTDEPLKESAWYEASAVQNGSHVRRHIRRYKRYKYMLYRNKARIYRKQRKDGK